MKRSFPLLAAACFLLTGCSLFRSPEIPQGEPSGQVEASTAASQPPEEMKDPFPPGTLLDITAKVLEGEQAPVTIRFVDAETLAVECLQGQDGAAVTKYYQIPEDQAEPGKTIPLARPNSYDRQLSLEDGGQILISDDLTKVIRRTPAGEETILLDGAASSPQETYWILTARGKWGAVSANAEEGSPACYLLDLEQDAATKLEISGEVLPSDIEGSLLLFTRPNPLNLAADTNLYLYDAVAGSLQAFDMGTGNGASDAVLSTGGEYLLSCDQRDEENGAHHFRIYETQTGAEVQAFQLDQVYHLADSTFQNMALSADGSMLALIACTEYQDFVPHVLLYRVY